MLYRGIQFLTMKESFPYVYRLVSLSCRQFSLRSDRHSSRLVMINDDNDLKARYAETVEQLNSLQSNASVLAAAASAGDSKRRQPENLIEMARTLNRLEITNEDLSKLSYIHVSGTKGKGSVSAFTESLLRHRGLKTGFYSSPHLIEVRERIRINGSPLSRLKFVKYFWSVYNKLEATKGDYEGTMPSYFRFLTLMGLHVFLHEEVDVVVMEVGVGGRFDCTNIIPAPVVCGITQLGYDHTSVLGHTMDEIAWNKAGIMKNGVSLAVTCRGQPENAEQVLRREADAVECRLSVVPDLQSYPVPPSSVSPPTLGIHGPPQLTNASMALQLSEIWLWKQGRTHRDEPIDGSSPFPLDNIHLEALAKTEWPGRCSIVDRSEKLRLHLDGAHTRESLEICTEWFDAKASGARVAVFNVTGGRNSRPFLQLLLRLNLELIIFCPNLIHRASSNKPELSYGTSDAINSEKLSTPRDSQMKVCESLHSEWRSLAPDSIKSVVLHSVEDVLDFLDHMDDKCDLKLPQTLTKAERVDVLITGSLHLVGDFYALVKPDLYV